MPPELLSLEDRGLDLVLGGGVRLVERVPGRSGTTLLIRGPAGAGKTLLGLHVAAALARDRGAIAYGCIELLPSELAAQASSHCAVARGLQIADSGHGERAMVGVVTVYPRLLDLEDGADSLGEVIERFMGELHAAGVDPKVLVIDSLSDGYGLGGNVAREFADAVCKIPAHLGVAVILLEECAPGASSPWVFAADTVIELGVVSEDAEATRASPFERRLIVSKHRFGPSDFGPHRFSLDGAEGMRVYPRPSAWLEPWATAVPAGPEPTERKDAPMLDLPLRESLQVTGRVVAVYGPDLQRVHGIASGIEPVTPAGAPHGSELYVDLAVPLGQREDIVGDDRLRRRLGLAHPYLSAHRLLRILLDEVRALCPLRRVVIGDLNALRSFWGEDGLRRALGVFCILMRGRDVAVVLYESAPTRVGFNSRSPIIEPGMGEAQAVDFADVSVEVMSDSVGGFATTNKVVVTQRRDGVIMVSAPPEASLLRARARVQERLRMVLPRLPSELRREVVVFGSAAIVLRGVDLGRVPNDLDLFVSDDAFERLSAEKGFELHAGSDPTLRFLRVAGPVSVELWPQFPGVTFGEMSATASVTSESFGVRVATLPVLLKWKRAQRALRRNAEDDAKDQRDIERIERALGES